MFYGVSGRATWVREMFFDGGYGVAGATLEKSFPTFSLSSFLSLMKEKRAKENQAPTGGGEVGRVQDRAGVVFLDEGNRATCAPKTKSDESNRATRATLGMCFPTFFLSSFLSLMKEKRAKENQAPTGGREVGRVREGAGVVFSEVGRVRDGAGAVLSEVCRVREGADVVFSDGGEWAKKIPAKRLDGGNLRVVANDGMGYVGDSVSGALRSKMERRM